MNNQSKMPVRSTKYVGRLTNTDRWDSFSARPDDIFVCTPPKCGTTWTQAICANLIFGTSKFEGKITDISPWIDSTIESEEVCSRTLEAQKHRRFIKTHTPLDGIPYFDSCDYLIVYRDPRDTYFSVRNHMLNMVNPPAIPQLSADPTEGFMAWVEMPFEKGVGEQRSLEAFSHHFLSFWHYRHLENFHFFHYSDLKSDLGGAVFKIAETLKLEMTDSRADEICNAVSFTEMKKNAGAFTPASGKLLFKNDEDFFKSGKNNQWREILGPSELAMYKSRITQLLEAEAIDWLEHEDI